MSRNITTASIRESVLIRVRSLLDVLTWSRIKIDRLRAEMSTAPVCSKAVSNARSFARFGIFSLGTTSSFAVAPLTAAHEHTLGPRCDGVIEQDASSSSLVTFVQFCHESSLHAEFGINQLYLPPSVVERFVVLLPLLLRAADGDTFPTRPLRLAQTLKIRHAASKEAP